jgi:saccharopine dehydrogenase (NADP+, L-glutamate forming)
VQTIHWLGTGLSSLPGLKSLIESDYKLVVYNRTLEKTTKALRGVKGNFRVLAYSLSALDAHVRAGDVVVSMLPGEFHVDVAKRCLSLNAHFVSSSYISPEMQGLHGAALDRNLCLVNEVGLDPGIDHSLSHALVSDYKNSSVFSESNQHSFLSYCGGLSAVPNDFCYKFSWSPLGVLKALMSPSLSIRDGKKYHVDKPWEAIELYALPMPWGEESFEVYPNRDSLPFIKQYQLDGGINIKQFVRGTLRYQGWKDAWSDIFSEVDSLNSDEAPEHLNKLSSQLWNQYAFAEGEQDRVILTVELKAKQNEKTVWHKQYCLDTKGNNHGSSMAQLVSHSVALAVQSVIDAEISPGVSAAPDDENLVSRWLDKACSISDHFVLIDHLS